MSPISSFDFDLSFLTINFGLQIAIKSMFVQNIILFYKEKNGFIPFISKKSSLETCFFIKIPIMTV